MPLVRIDLPQGKPESYSKAVGDAVYDAMLKVLNVPQNDRFFVIAAHPRHELVIDPTYLGVERSEECIVIQLTLNSGRSMDTKKAFYKAVADGLHEKVGLRREDVFISLVEVSKENWSFGNGEAQYT